MWKGRRTRHNNTITVVDGIKFRSKKEAKRYINLKALLAAEEISDLRLQPRYKIIINGILCFTYIPDFEYFQKGDPVLIVEDVKGFLEYHTKLKINCVKAQYQDRRFTLWPEPKPKKKKSRKSIA